MYGVAILPDGTDSLVVIDLANCTYCTGGGICFQSYELEVMPNGNYFIAAGTVRNAAPIT